MEAINYVGRKLKLGVILLRTSHGLGGFNFNSKSISTSELPTIRILCISIANTVKVYEY